MHQEGVHFAREEEHAQGRNEAAGRATQEAEQRLSKLSFLEPEHRLSRVSLLEPERRLSRFSFLEADETHFDTQTLSRLLDHKQLAATQEWLLREKQLKRIGRTFLRVLMVVATVVFSICLTTLLVYIHLKPHAPDFAVTAAGFVSVTISPLNDQEIELQQATGRGNYFAAYFTFNSSYTIFFQNDNDKVDMYVSELRLIVFYNGFWLGETKKEPFVQLRKTSQSFKVFVVQENFPVPLNVYYTITKAGSMPIYFGADILMRGRMSTVAGLKSPQFRFRVRCSLVLQRYVIIENLCQRRSMG